jgi:hypothetical protein
VCHSDLLRVKLSRYLRESVCGSRA